MSETVQGRRVHSYEAFFDDANVPCYDKTLLSSSQWEGGIEVWNIRPPCGHNGMIGPEPAGKGHQVDEHEDGTITVEPKPGNSNSILCTWPVDGKPCGWHGYIDRGVWRTC